MNYFKTISNKKFTKNMNFNSVLHNRIVLYVFVFMAVVDLMFFASISDIRSFFTLIIVGFLTSFFSKNMIVILFIALTLTHILKYGTNVSEGLENKGDDNIMDNSGNIMDNSGNIMDNSGNIMDNSGNIMDKKDEAMTQFEPEKKNKKNNSISIDSLKNDFQDFQSVQEKILTGMKEIDPLLTRAEQFIEKFEHYKNGGAVDNDD